MKEQTNVQPGMIGYAMILVVFLAVAVPALVQRDSVAAKGRG